MFVIIKKGEIVGTKVVYISSWEFWW